MTDGTLFISDSSISNPIVRAQGIPFLGFQAEMGKTCVFFSFENKDDENFYEKIVADIKAEVSRKIIFEKIVIKPGKFLPPWFSFVFDGIKKILLIVRSNKINVLHARSFFPSFLGIIIKQVFNRKLKLIFDNRGLLIEEEILKGHWKSRSIKVYFFRAVEKYILKNADVIVVVSQKFKEYLINKYESSIDNLSEKTFLIPNRTQIKLVTDSRIFSERNTDKTVITYSGSSAVWQSLGEMKKLFIHCIDVFPESELHIITYNKEDFADVFNTEHINSRIKFISAKSSEVFSHLVKCNFGILLRENNAINNVASPLKFAEYLAAGLPVLISEGVGDFSNKVIEHNVGVVIKNSDYKNALYEMKSLIEDKGIHERCRKLAEKEFNIKSSFIEYENIYHNLM